MAEGDGSPARVVQGPGPGGPSDGTRTGETCRQVLDLRVAHASGWHDGAGVREGQFVEFALYLDLYAEEAYGRGGTPQISVRINPILGPGEGLHDLYNDLMEARKSTQE